MLAFLLSVETEIGLCDECLSAIHFGYVSFRWGLSPKMTVPPLESAHGAPTGGRTADDMTRIMTHARGDNGQTEDRTRELVVPVVLRERAEGTVSKSAYGMAVSSCQSIGNS